MESMAPENHQLDTSVEIVTPENIAFRYHVAGPFRRLPAYIIDMVVQALLLLVVGGGTTILFGMIGLPALGIGLWLIFGFVLSWFYGGLFETYWNGQTPGKRMMRIRVIATDGQPVNGLQAVLRNFLRAIDGLPLNFYQVGLFTASMNDRFQRLGDLAAGTMVVVEQREWFQGLLRVDDPEVARITQEIPPSFQASPSLAKALAAYVQRRLAFPVPRRMEVARHLAEPLIRRLGLPPYTNPDLLLCAVYQRAFITDIGEPVDGVSPFDSPKPPAAARAAIDEGENPFAGAATPSPEATGS